MKQEHEFCHSACKGDEESRLTIENTPLLVNLGVLNVTVLYRGIVIGDEQFLKELYRECALADTSIPDDN